jgi:hypothetical protein
VGRLAVTTSDQPPADTYKETAKLTYENLLEMRRLAFTAQADHGKWLISSIFLMHGAAIGGLAFKAGTSGAPTYLNAISWFVLGLTFALASGFSTWCNFSLAAEQYHEWAKPNMIVNRAYWPSDTARDFRIKLTKWLAIIFGFCSVFCLIAGAVHIWLIW